MCIAPKVKMPAPPPPPQAPKTPTGLDAAGTKRLGAMLGFTGQNLTLLSGGALDLMPKTDKRKTLLGDSK